MHQADSPATATLNTNTIHWADVYPKLSISITEDSDIEYYLYDGMEEIATLNETGAISECKILGLNNRTVMVETPHDMFVTMVDAHNNIRKLVDPTNGATIQSYNYDAFHELHPQYDSLTRYRFASRQTDPETGLIYFGQRYYDPFQLRWITPDPLGPIDITNLYAYNQNNPFKYFDPDGRCPLVIPIYFIGALTFPILPAIGLAVLTSAAICGTAYGAVCLVNHLNNVCKPHTTYGITDLISPDTINVVDNRYFTRSLERRKKDGGTDSTLPVDPFNDPNLEDITHPKAVKTGNYRFRQKKTGEELLFDKGDPSKSGHQAHDHYHRTNPNKYDKNHKRLDENGNPVRKGSDASHLYPLEWVWW